MTQSCNHDTYAVLFVDKRRIFFAQLFSKSESQMSNSDGVLKPGMRCIWVDKMAVSNLLEEPQPLELRGVYDGHSHCWDANMPVNAKKTIALISILINVSDSK